MWAKGAYKTLCELMRFRLLMIKLEDQHPDIYQVVKDLHRGIDMHELGLYDGNKFKKTDNESTSQTSSNLPTGGIESSKEALMGGEEE